MIALLGGCVASFGFFFLPVIEIKPNRLASGLPVGLLEIPGDMRYLLLFLLALTPVLLAFLGDRNRRGWAMTAVGNLIVILSLYLPALAGSAYLLGAEALFEAGTRISNPRVLTSAQSPRVWPVAISRFSRACSIWKAAAPRGWCAAWSAR